MEALYVPARESRLQAGRRILICSRIELPDVVPFSSKDHVAGHLLLCERSQHLGSNTLGLDVEIEPDLHLASETQGVIEMRNVDSAKTASSPRAEVHPVQFPKFRVFDLSRGICEAIEEIIVIQDKFAVERPRYIHLDNVATHAGGKRQRFERILRQIAVRGAMAQRLHRTLAENARMHQRRNEHQRTKKKALPAQVH